MSDISTGQSILDTPIGELLIRASSDGLTGVYFEGRCPSVAGESWRDDRRQPVVRWARAELAAYFAGELRTFSVPLAPQGTEFQLRVWSALRRIPFGAVVSYRDVAENTGNARAVRAVGAANGRNPLPIIVPCHRVIGSNGTMVGFGGGLSRKRWLLAHEGALQHATSP